MLKSQTEKPQDSQIKELKTEEIPVARRVEDSDPVPDEAEDEKPEVVAASQELPSPSQVNVQVLNGCGVRGIAARVRGILREREFDVLSYGNARKVDYPSSFILVRSAGSFGEQAAKVLARSVGINESRISIQRDPNLVDIHVTLVLGLDYKNLNL